MFGLLCLKFYIFVCIGLQQRRRKGRLRMAAEGAQKLLEACKDIVKDEGKLKIFSYL